MNMKMQPCFAVASLAALCWCASTAQAQFAGSNLTNLIDHVTNNWSGAYYVGTNAFNDALIIQNAGRLTNSQGFLGYNVGDINNSALVTGAGSVWTNSGNLTIGNAGALNTLTIAGGGKVCDNNGYLGSNTLAGGNTALVTDAGSIWSNRATLVVGNSGAGNTLTVINQGTVYNTTGYLGYNASASNNVARVTGAGSLWNNSSDLNVGYQGAASSLSIANGGKVVSVNGYIGNSANNNAAQVTDAGSLWNMSASLTVGNNGSGNTLTITNGGVVYNAAGTLGANSGANSNAVIVTGAGSAWTNTGTITVGNSGLGNTLLVAQGATVVDQGATIGNNTGNNIVTVTDAGSVWTNGGNLIIGSMGANSNALIIAKGGTVYSPKAYIGASMAPYNDYALVTGAGSVWNNSSFLYVGDYGIGCSLTISNGGTVNNTSGYIGRDAGYASNNVVTVTGAGSVWSNSADLFVGNNGTRETLNILNGGAVSVGGTLTISALTVASNNTVNVAGGQLTASNINIAVTGSGLLSLAGGSVVAQQLIATNGPKSAVSFTAGLLDLGAATVANGSTFTVGDGASPATLNLRGGLSSFSNGLAVARHAFLTGFGAITNGNALIQAGGTLAPGNGSALGVLSFSNNLTLAGTMDIKLQNALGPFGTGDFVNVAGTLDVSGGEIDFIPPDTPTNAVYVFCQYGTLLGTLAEVDDIPAGYAFVEDFNGNEMALVAVPEPMAVGLLVLFGGGLVAWRRLRRWGI